jgi:transposase
MTKFNDLSRSLVALEQDSTLIAVIEMSQASWLVGGVIPGLDREPRRKLDPEPQELLKLINRWRGEAEKAGRMIRRVCIAYEAGRDGFWLARWLPARGIECHVMHPTSLPVSREHRRAKSDRLDLGLLMRAFLGWLRGEKKHCSMVAIPTIEEEDAKRPLRERDRLVGERTRLTNLIKSLLVLHGISGFKPRRKGARQELVQLRTAEGVALPPATRDQILFAMEQQQLIETRLRQIEINSRKALLQAPQAGLNPMILTLGRIVGMGLPTSERLAREALSRPLRDHRAVGRYVGLTGSPDESGQKRREQGLAKAGNSRVRRDMLQLAWRLTRHQPNCALVKWFRERTADGRAVTRKTMIVALARKLLIALWDMVHFGVIPEGMTLYPDSRFQLVVPNPDLTAARGQRA